MEITTGKSREGMSRMKALVFSPFGGPDVIEEKELSVLPPQAQEFLVKIYAISVNPTWRWFS
jgi:NADPH:quinone reductase-like Zn-dependent oxidoreductase